jgi:hypothetical protein
LFFCGHCEAFVFSFPSFSTILTINAHNYSGEHTLAQYVNILFVGDIVGKPGLVLTETLLKQYLQKYSIDCCIINGENVTEGKGISEEDAKALFNLGAHVITTGNHVWDRWDHRKVLASSQNILRPVNYPRENPGNGFTMVKTKEGVNIGVINVQGRTFMTPIDDPFRQTEWTLGKMPDTKVILVDFHAEATAEKLAYAWYFEGKISAIIGTHTHIPTSDAQILPKGTAYITDVGMTGPFDSVIGLKKEVALKRFMLQTPNKFEVAQHDVHFCAVYIRVDAVTGKAVKIESIVFPSFQTEVQTSSSE